LQPLVDGSISKTVALPHDTRPGAVQEIFETAYRLHLKGCTVFREGARSGVLTDRETESLRELADRPAHCCGAERETD